MFQVFGDVIVLSPDGETFQYYEEYPINLLHDLPRHTGRRATGIIAVVLEYGPDFSGPGVDTFYSMRANTIVWNAHECNFLHPVLYYYESLPSPVHHVVEDFLTDWSSLEAHVTPLRHFLDFATGRDLRMRFSGPCFVESMTALRPSAACTDQYLQGRGLTATREVEREARMAGFYHSLGLFI